MSRPAASGKMDEPVRFGLQAVMVYSITEDRIQPEIAYIDPIGILHGEMDMGMLLTHGVRAVSGVLPVIEYAGGHWSAKIQAFRFQCRCYWAEEHEREEADHPKDGLCQWQDLQGLTSSSVKSNAFKGIYKKATFKCPKGKAAAYKKILLKKGAPKTCKFK